MSRYIDADALQEIMLERKQPSDGADDTKERWRYVQWLVDYNSIADAPTVDVAEVVHSHWVWGPYVAKIGGHGYTCALCGRQSEECGNFCTWCGAKMDDEEQLEAERKKK